MSKGYFVTGTDTDVGKTRCALGLMASLRQQGFSVVAMKPVASGCRQTTAGLRNDDALLLQAQGSIPVDYPLLNPYAFAPPIAPHLAAEQSATRIEFDTIVAAFNQLKRQAEYIVVEGVGGWRVPLNERESVSDLAVALGLPVILVVGLKLGCINHALLSAESIRAAGCELAGWIANALSPNMAVAEQNIQAIAARIQAPLLGSVPFLDNPDALSIAAALEQKS